MLDNFTLSINRHGLFHLLGDNYTYRFTVVKLIHLKITLLDIKMLTLVEIYQYFEGICCRHLLKVEKLLQFCTSQLRKQSRLQLGCWERENRKTLWNIIVRNNVKLGILFFSEIITGTFRAALIADMCCDDYLFSDICSKNSCVQQAHRI